MAARAGGNWRDGEPHFGAANQGPNPTGILNPRYGYHELS